MNLILEALENALSEGKDTILATVTASSGATPRGAGARMLVGEEAALQERSAAAPWSFNRFKFHRRRCEKSSPISITFIFHKTRSKISG